MNLDFTIDATSGEARAANITVRGRSFRTPAFLPVATRGSVKCMDMDEVTSLGYELILMNAYHLHQRPGEDVVAGLGGLHKFTGYGGAILTDSGGYQLFSFGRGAELQEEGATVYSPYDGTSELLTPEAVVDIQLKLSSDIMMPLDICLGIDVTYDDVASAVEGTDAWLKRSVERWREHASGDNGVLFGIVQGGIHEKLRDESLQRCAGYDLPGYALGGLSVGESRDDFERVVRGLTPKMPRGKPRYLMGVGRPEDILMAIDAGVDMFDCVLPTRNARNGMAFTSRGTLNLMNAGFKGDERPLDPECECPTCKKYPAAFLSHQIRLKEITGLKLLTLHNLCFYKRLIDQARSAISDGEWESYFRDRTGKLKTSGNPERDQVTYDE